MTKDEYIEKALEQIKDSKLKVQIKNELTDHIDERIQYFTDCGYDEETALEMAVDKMGSPDSVSENFAKLHDSSSGTVFDVIFGIAFLLSSLFFIFITLDDLYDFNIVTEVWLLLFILAGAIISNRFRTHKVMRGMLTGIVILFISGFFIKAVDAAFWTIRYLSWSSFKNLYSEFIEYNSSLMTVFYGLITGNSHSVAVMNSFSSSVKNLHITLLSVLFYAIVAYIIVNNLIALYKQSSGSASAKTGRMRQRSFIQLVGVTGFVIALVTALGIVTQNADFNKNKHYSAYDYSYFYIAESDEPVDFEDLDFGSFRKFRFKPRVFGGFEYAITEITDDDYETFGSYNSISHDLPMKGAKYYSDGVTLEFSTSKKYICVIPFDYDYTSSNNDEKGEEIRLLDYAEWKDTESSDVLSFPIDDNEYTRLVYNIKPDKN